ncbi:MAG: threonine/serine dehydratase [Oscillospiraceae bacterium]|nr:threonine/serine dehydratase [Oscillospiraceae bacterium]
MNKHRSAPYANPSSAPEKIPGSATDSNPGSASGTIPGSASPAVVPVVTYGMIMSAHVNNRAYVKRTPLLRAEKLEKLFDGAQIFLKLENLQHTGSFKVRGVINKMLSLSEGERARGVAAASSGNHAQAVAYIAAKLGTKSVIVMPEDAPIAKIAGTKEYGAEVVLHGLTVGERERKCGELIEKFGYSLVHSYADVALIAGHGTIIVEASEQMEQMNEMVAGRRFDEIVMPCGAGAIVSGAAVAAKGCMPGAIVTAVEPAAVPRFTASLRAGAPVTVEMGATIADGLRVNVAEPINFALIRDYVDRMLTVGEAPIRRALMETVTRANIVAEPSACVGIAAALDGAIDTGPGRSICFVISGGNMDASVLADILMHN